MVQLRSRLVRGTAPLAVLSSVAALASAGVWLAGDARRLLHEPEPAGLLLAVVEVCTALLLGRWALGGALTLVALAGQGRRTARPSGAARAAVVVSPRLLRPAVAALLAVGVATATAGPASAATRSPDLPAVVWSAPTTTAAVPVDGVAPRASQAPSTAADGLPAPGWTPLPPTPSQPPVRLVASAAHREASSPDVVVRRGDSLWAIVARSIGPHATTGRIAAQWPRWYAANRRAIGDDPDLLRPGTTLHPPVPEAAR